MLKSLVDYLKTKEEFWVDLKIVDPSYEPGLMKPKTQNEVILDTISEYSSKA